jgi:hypothetical protein
VKRGAGRRFAWCAGLAVASVLAAQQVWVSASNFHGADEWLGIELASRGVVSVPYANRPLVFLWLAAAQHAWPDDLAAYWAFTSLAFLATGLLTAWLAIRILPRAPMLALLAGVFAVAWAPLDWLRLDTTLIAGYAGFTAGTLLALALLVESWLRQSRALLLCSGALALSCALGVESVIPLLAAGPLLVLATQRRRATTATRARLVSWLSTWSGFVVLCALFAAAPALAGLPSYQTGALRLDLAPQRVLWRLVRLLGMQALPLVTSAPRELAHPAVPVAVLGLALGVALAWRAAPRASRGRRGRDSALALGLGLALAAAAHLGLALTASLRDPGRSQLLSAPGFGLCLAASVNWVGTTLAAALARFGGARAGRSQTFARGAVLLIAAWTVAVGTGRVVAMQGEWDAERNAYPSQRRALADLVRQAPALRPNTLVILLNGSDAAFPLSFTFRHAVALLYPGQAIGLVADGEPFAYPWARTPEGVAVVPWPVIRGPWGVRPTLHRWDEIVVARAGPGGALEVCEEWPAERLGPLPAGALYRPDSRVVSAAAAPPSRRLLRRLR